MGPSLSRLVVAILLAPGGCAHPGPAAPGAPSPPVTVTFRVEGGFAGQAERLEVGPEGELALFRHEAPAGTGRLDRATLERLHGVVDSAAFRALGARYMPESACCDRFTYTVRVRRSDGEQSVSTLDGAAWPRSLADAIALLDEARRQVEAPGTD